MAFHLVIDGYNLIRQSPELRRFDKEGLEQGREMLLKELLAYQRIKKHAITVVFDGWIEGHFSESHARAGGIRVIFSRRGEKADEVIKRLAAQEKGGAIVVTSDRDLAHSCSRVGCEVVPSLEFATKMQLARYVEAKGGIDDTNDESWSQSKGTKKKGPSRRLAKSRRHHRTVLKKL